jgi:hypothetical protein
MLQALDCLVFGMLKSQARRGFGLRASEEPFRQRIKSEACEDAITAWYEITDEVVQASWEIDEEDAWSEKGEAAAGALYAARLSRALVSFSSPFCFFRRGGR